MFIPQFWGRKGAIFFQQLQWEKDFKTLDFRL
jgi:hypothetical protein